MDRFIACNPEAEEAVIGSMLIDSDAILKVTEIVGPTDFYNERLAWIYDAILALHSKNEPADFVTVCDELERKAQLDEIGGAAYVMDLINAVPTSIHAVYYANIVESNSVLRNVTRAAGQIAQLAYEGRGDVDSVCSKALQIMEEAIVRKRGQVLKTLSLLVDEGVARIKEAAATIENGDQVSIPFNLGPLDNATGGMYPSDLVVIAAASKGGKTSLAIQIAYKAAKINKIPVAVFSLEMQDWQVAEKILGPETGYTTKEMRQGEILDWTALKENAENAKSDIFFVDDSSSLSIAELSARVKVMHAKHGIKLIVVDYAQLMSGGKKFENRTQELAYIARGLKALAKDLDIAIIAIAQLNREHYKNENKEPVTENLEGSSQWEKEATLVILLWRNSDPMATEEEKQQATIILDRSRNTPTGKYIVGWNGETTTFSDTPKPMSPRSREALREKMMLQCNAVSNLSWSSWGVYEGNFQAFLEEARHEFHGMPDEVRPHVGSVLASLKNGSAIDLESVAAIEAKAKTPLLRRVVAIAHRRRLIDVARDFVIPALKDRRFVIFHGPAGRGKTFMSRIVQAETIRGEGIPFVFLNWRSFDRQIKEGFGTSSDAWRITRAPIVAVDDPDKLYLTEYTVGQLYDVFDEAGSLEAKRGMLILLNDTPEQFTKKLLDYGHIGQAISQRVFQRNRPITVDFSSIPMWKSFDEDPKF